MAGTDTEPQHPFYVTASATSTPAGDGDPEHQDTAQGTLQPTGS